MTTLAGARSRRRLAHGRQILAAEHVQRQVAVVVVVAVEEAALLRAAQRHVRGVDVQPQFAWRTLPRAAPTGDELLQQHAVQRLGLRSRGRGLQPAERGGAGQRLITPDGRLQHPVIAQRVVVAHVGPTQAQAVHTLRNHAGQLVASSWRALAGLTAIAQRAGSRCAQPQAVIRAPQQQRAALAAQIAAAEVPVNDASTQPSKVQLLVRALWPRQSTVGIGSEIPMTTRLGTRLPTSPS